MSSPLNSTTNPLAYFTNLFPYEPGVGGGGASSMVGACLQQIGNGATTAITLGTNVVQVVKAACDPQFFAMKQTILATLTLVNTVETRVTADPSFQCSKNLTNFFALSKDLQTAINDPAITQEKLQEKFTAYKTAFEKVELFVHSSGVHHKPSVKAASSLDLLCILNPQEPTPSTKSSLSLDEQFTQKVHQLGQCVRRKAEITAVFKDEKHTALLNTINSPSEKTYKDAFSLAILVHANQYNLFARPFVTFYLNIKRWSVGFCTGIILDQAIPKLIQLKNNLMNPSATPQQAEKSRTEIMNFLSEIFMEGLPAFSCVIEDIAIRIASNDPNLGGGTPLTKFGVGLMQYTALRANHFNEKKFYEAVFDKILTRTFSWSLSRRFWKAIVNYLNILEDPIPNLSSGIRNANGFQHSLDKAITNLVDPLVKDLASQETKLNQGPDFQPKTVKAFKSRAWSQQTQESLEKTIKSFFLAVDLSRASGTSEIAGILKARNESLVEQMTTPLAKDNLFSQIISPTAKVGALEVLRSLDKILTPSFLLEHSVDLLDIMNNAFSASVEVSEETLEKSEKERTGSLNSLSDAIIHHSIESIALLNPEVLHIKMNRALSGLRTEAKSILSMLDAGVPRSLPLRTAHFKLIAHRLKNVEKGMDDFINSHSFNADQKKSMQNALSTLQNHLHSLCGIAFSDENKKIEQINLELSAYLVEVHTDITTGEAFSDKINGTFKDVLGVSITDTMKRITKAALQHILREKFDQAFVFTCNPLTVKHFFAHQTFAAILKA